MKKEAIGTNGIFVILALALTFTITVFIAIGSAEVTELKVNPEVVIQGANVSLSGRAAPDETVWIKSSFVISLPISDGKYSAEFVDILFPPGEKKFSVTAENVENIRISLAPLFGSEREYPLDGPLEATSGIATIAISLPFTMWGMTVNINGEKDVKVYGNAAEDAEFVNLSVDMSVKVIADTNGKFKLDVNTGGIPLGEFMITAGAITKTVKVVSTMPVFDTGSPEYPYPSMCGIHNGTLTPNQTITVSLLYTYSCLDTCGHTERVTIRNDMGVIVDANWTGYRGDWRNITFDAVTLVAGETYNYSICTGSYPQIIHERTANVTGGTITCSQFTDANGKVYIDWIPAIILY
uniref:IPT/TIG domain-containing protein n=1 Tax=Candidatus Methanophaga sp. ANME-1 ERB7 TaxID=2759913 RepID=A0A7G9ZD67_9EURY|nr:hypothetical protein MFNKIFOF_00023 [Methanosarcinales archaeon ANME-1 ERB7]